MKLFIGAIFVVLASHYRGGTYNVIQRSNGKLGITNTQTWRLGADSYDEIGCRLTAPSATPINAQCTSGTCQAADLYYTALFVGDDYCYGDGYNEIAKPSSAFTFGWNSCCWVQLTDDRGGSVNGGNMVQYMRVNDRTNNSPSFKLPPLWLIMAGCPAQSINLAPTDPDGDKIRCRWATETEAAGATYSRSAWPSLSLDGNNCIVTYDGTKDSSTSGVKPIGLMMEDLDANNNVRSSIPVQFLAQVWTPSMNSTKRSSNYPDWFGEDDHDHDDLPVTRRRRSAQPAYCNAVPYFVPPTPEDGAVINSASGSVSFTLKAESKTGYIAAFSYQSPSGMNCTKVNSDGEITCNWKLTADQLKIESHSFCYDATDNIGLVSQRRCLTMENLGPDFGLDEVPRMKECLELLETCTDSADGLPPFLRYDQCSTCVSDDAIAKNQSCHCCEIMEGWEEELYTGCCQPVPKPCPLIVTDCAKTESDPFKCNACVEQTAKREGTDCGCCEETYYWPKDVFDVMNDHFYCCAEGDKDHPLHDSDWEGSGEKFGELVFDF